MGTSFVAIGARGFWMRDSLLELWLRLLALHVEDPSGESSRPCPATTIRDQWLLASRGFFTGCVPDGLEDAVSTETGKKVVVKAIESLLGALSASRATIDKDALNLLGFEGRFTRDIEVATLLEVGRAFLDLIDGKIVTGASDTSFMPGG